MVDTINPNTNQPDSWGDSSTPTPNATPENRFYGGFNQPDTTKINLAGDSQFVSPPSPTAPENQSFAPASQETPSSVSPVRQAVPTAVQDVAAPVHPSEVKHTTYVNTSDVINWRGILVIAVIGLASTVIIGASLYFALGALNNSKLKAQQDRLTSIQNELSALQVAPTPLTLPTTTETTTPSPSDENTVTTPVVTPTETPVTTPATTPTQNDDGSKTAAG